MSDTQRACSCRSSRTQQECVTKISHLLNTLKYISQNFVANLDGEIIITALHELEDICQQLLQVWNSFCIVPLLYLVEPVFRSLRVMVFLPSTSIMISCSHFLSAFMNFRVQLHSSMAAERIFSSMFDCSTMNLLILNVRKTFEPNATDESQLIAVSSIVCLLCDLLENGASDLYMSSGFIVLLFELYVTILSKLNFQDHRHLDLKMKCSSSFPTVLKLRSKADIVVSSFQLAPNCSEEFVRDFRSRNVRIQAWAALGLEIYPLLLETFSECLICETDRLNNLNEHVNPASHLLSKVCYRQQLFYSSKLFERSSSAIRCVRLVVDAMNRWRHHLAMGSAQSRVERLKAAWFDSESSFVIFLLLYCFDLNDVIRNQAISTLKEIGAFCPSSFSQSENSKLIFDALSTILELCECPRLISDINWLRALHTFDKDAGVIPRPIISPVRVAFCTFVSAHFDYEYTFFYQCEVCMLFW